MVTLGAEESSLSGDVAVPVGEPGVRAALDGAAVNGDAAGCDRMDFGADVLDQPCSFSLPTWVGRNKEASERMHRDMISEWGNDNQTKRINTKKHSTK